MTSNTIVFKKVCRNYIIGTGALNRNPGGTKTGMARQYERYDQITKSFTKKELRILAVSSGIILNYAWYYKNAVEEDFVELSGKDLQRRIPVLSHLRVSAEVEAYLKEQAGFLETALREINHSRAWDIKGFYLKGEKNSSTGLAEISFGTLNKLYF